MVGPLRWHRAPGTRTRAPGGMGHPGAPGGLVFWLFGGGPWRGLDAAHLQKAAALGLGPVSAQESAILESWASASRPVSDNNPLALGGIIFHVLGCISRGSLFQGQRPGAWTGPAGSLSPRQARTPGSQGRWCLADWKEPASPVQPRPPQGSTLWFLSHAAGLLPLQRTDFRGPPSLRSKPWGARGQRGRSRGLAGFSETRVHSQPACPRSPPYSSVLTRPPPPFCAATKQRTQAGGDRGHGRLFRAWGPGEPSLGIGSRVHSMCPILGPWSPPKTCSLPRAPTSGSDALHPVLLPEAWAAPDPAAAC